MCGSNQQIVTECMGFICLSSLKVQDTYNIIGSLQLLLSVFIVHMHFHAHCCDND